MGAQAEPRIEGSQGMVWRPPDMVHRAAAELLGTLLLVLFGAGAVLAALRIGDGALDHAGRGMIALSFGLIVAIVVYAFGLIARPHLVDEEADE